MLFNGSIMALLVAKKGTQIVHAFRRKGIRFHKEVQYKKKVKTANPIVAMVSASRDKDGFTGYIGLCEGHPRLSDPTSTTNYTFLPLKNKWNPELSKWLHQSVKPSWTTNDLYRELLALNSCQPAVQFDEASDDIDLITCEPVFQSPRPSYDSGSSTEEEDIVGIYQHKDCGVDKGTKRKVREEPQVEPTKKTSPPGKGTKRIHQTAIVSPTQDLQVKKSSNDRVVRASVRVTRKDESKSAAVPSTPARANAKKTPRTPPGKMSTKVCDHEKWVDFQSWNHTYYVPKYMKGRVEKYYPKKCKQCDKTFVNKSKTDSTFDPEKEFRVTSGQEVHVCSNATKDNHCCNYAVCEDCHSQIITM
jgi:hypothetical protein